MALLEVRNIEKHFGTNDPYTALIIKIRECDIIARADQLQKQKRTSYDDVSNRLIIIDDVNNDTVKNGLVEIENVDAGVQDNQGFAVPLVSGLIIGAIIGIAAGVWIKSKK